MQKIFRKRVVRDLKSNSFRYLALGLLILLGMYMVVSLVGAAETVIRGVDDMAQEHQLEDGEFSMYAPLTEAQQEKLSDEGLSLEKMFYLDYGLTDDSTVRVFQNRQSINLIAIDEGRQAASAGEVTLEKRYCTEHHLQVGESIEIDGSEFCIVGIGTVPDYDCVLKNMSDTNASSSEFGLAFVTEEAYKTFENAGNSVKSETYTYAYHLNGKMTDKELKEQLGTSFFNNAAGVGLTQFTKEEDNPRIKASAGDQVINKYAGLVSGVIVMVLFTYVISVFVVHGIEKECSIIGTLYALGVKKKNLICHYLSLPVLVTLIAGIVGTLIGFSKGGVNLQMQDSYTYYSFPDLSVVYPAYLIVYGTVMPPVVAAVVNYFVISKKLSQPALKMIINEQQNSRISNINLGKMGFVGRFQIRQMIRESRTVFTVLFGMLISMLVMMLGFDCYVMSQHTSVDNKKDTKYEYMYTYKYPSAQVPEGGSAGYAKTFSKEAYGYNLDVTVIGIDKENPYFDVRPEQGKDKLVVAASTAEKFNLEKGDHLSLTDKADDKNYTFTIEDIVPYSVGLYTFMDIDSMRELFGQQKDYYNIVFSSKQLTIDESRLYEVTTKADISKASDVFIDKMMPMIMTMIIVSAIMFCVVMYLMMKVMIDRSAFSISLIKIFGYRTDEIRKLYLNGNFYMIAVGAAICIPLSKLIIDRIYPYLIANVACGMNLTFSWQLYAVIYAGVILLYLVINYLLVRKLKKMVPAEVLKNRE